MPFSDPLADGPVIQRSSQRALERGVTLGRVLEAVRAIRATSALPLLLFTYFNPLLQYGLTRLARDAKDAGADGVLVTDLPPEEAASGWRPRGRPGSTRSFSPRPRAPPSDCARWPRPAAASSTRSAAPG